MEDDRLRGLIGRFQLVDTHEDEEADDDFTQEILNNKYRNVLAKTGSPYYEVKDRPLGSDVTGGSHGASSSLAHRHLFKSDGTNLGLTSYGEFSEPSDNGYEYSIPFGKVRLDASLIDKALDKRHQDILRMQDIYDEMGLNEETPYRPGEYSFFGNNCQQFVRDLVNRADDISKGGNGRGMR